LPLDYESAGRGVPVLAVHPFPFDHEVYRPQLTAAASGELPVEFVSVKLPGFGGRVWPLYQPPVLRVEDLARELTEMVERLGLDRPVLVGAGLGGYAVLHALGTAPSTFRAGLVMGCKPGTDPLSNRPARANAARLALEEGRSAAADALATASLSPAQRPVREPAARAMVLRADPRALSAGVWGIHFRPDPSPLLERITVPLLVAVGADDPVCAVADAAELARGVPNGRLEVIDDCGHATPLERPDAVTELLTALLAEPAPIARG
jgi:pimeloyl-ACP methyl ester carboxylesterase